jgi:hypothetical protein
MKMKNILIVLTTGFLLFSCSERKENQPPKSELEIKMNKIAEEYVKLVLKIGQHDADYVDAYYGPEEWKPAELIHDGNDTLIHKQLVEEADQLLNELETLSHYNATKLETLRFRYLYKQILSAKTKLFMISGGELLFDEESKALYDAVSPSYPVSHYKKILDKLNKILPGNGDVSKRLIDFRSNFIIPKDKLDTVFTAAINECRRRTLQHISLPQEESFTVEYVTNKPWGGYNWYKGGNFSLIQVNTDLPIYIDRAVDLAAHEGYPGHHVYNVLLEHDLYKKNGWVEFSVYALFSPQSLIAEGTANYGINVAFPGKSRIEFEKEILFPLAGLDADKADDYYAVSSLLENLSYAGNEAARNYLDGRWNKEETKNWLIKYSLMTPEKAEKNIQFIEKYRSYVVNYNLGEDIVKEYMENNGGTEDNPEKRWEIFQFLLSTPQTPSGLK